ncbi:hypothetical protein WA158_008540 [Blastocystis sp. Blastoise]
MSNPLFPDYLLQKNEQLDQENIDNLARYQSQLKEPFILLYYNENLLSPEERRNIEEKHRLCQQQIALAEHLDSIEDIHEVACMMQKIDPKYLYNSNSGYPIERMKYIKKKYICITNRSYLEINLPFALPPRSDFPDVSLLLNPYGFQFSTPEEHEQCKQFFQYFRCQNSGRISYPLSVNNCMMHDVSNAVFCPNRYMAIGASFGMNAHFLFLTFDPPSSCKPIKTIHYCDENYIFVVTTHEVVPIYINNEDIRKSYVMRSILEDSATIIHSCIRTPCDRKDQVILADIVVYIIDSYNSLRVVTMDKINGDLILRRIIAHIFFLKTDDIYTSIVVNIENDNLISLVSRNGVFQIYNILDELFVYEMNTRLNNIMCHCMLDGSHFLFGSAGVSRDYKEGMLIKINIHTKIITSFTTRACDQFLSLEHQKNTRHVIATGINGFAIYDVNKILANTAPDPFLTVGNIERDYLCTCPCSCRVTLFPSEDPALLFGGVMTNSLGVVTFFHS